jgi:hypothetical protein
MPYRWTGTHAYRDHANDRAIEPGEQLPEDIAEQVAGAHPFDVERVEEPDDDDDDVAEAPFDPDEYTVDELRGVLDEGDYTDAELEALAEAEREDGEPRNTALEAIGAARE